MSNMEDILSHAAQKGMYVVDNENTDALYEEYDDQLQEADNLCEIIDPETRPYDSKYKARGILDKICNKLEANRTIASLEKKKALIAGLDYRIAAIRIRTGTISWECEEPHNAQTDLELACEFYIPGLVKLIDETTKEGEGETVTASVGDLPKPDIPQLQENCRADAMKCLNILGILWAGRSQVRKSLMYLLAANDFYESNIIGVPNKGKTRREMENSFTHNLFYLAQAYGHANDSKKSSYYCHMTLQRQLSSGLNEIKTALDWVKNCAGIADFYLAMKQYNNCALALASAEKIFKDKVTNELRNKDESSSSEGTVNFVSGNLNAAEIEADLHRRWAILDSVVLKRGYERENVRKTARELGVTLSEMETKEFLENGEGDYVYAEVTEEGEVPPESVFQNLSMNENASSQTEATSNEKKVNVVQFFSGLAVEQTVLLNGGDIDTFEKARIVFLRAAARIEASKRYYVLDGYVTDHATLVQEHSKLYHYLAGFEADSKRKLAMETRRVDMLLPLVKSLNKISYEVLHKQISYELGETSLAQLEIRLDKLRGPGGEINEKKVKKTEVVKCNELCKMAYCMFAHFGYLYAQSKDRNVTTCYTHFETLQLYQLATIACTEPDESLISEEEVRPFLNAHFLACRVLTKTMPTSDFLPPLSAGATVSNRAHFLVAAMRRYEWLSKFAPKICEKRGVDINTVFGEEWTICKDMVKLLPSKIDRMMYLGESGLSL